MINLLPWQAEPCETLVGALVSGRSALDASDTGTGKTYVAAATAAKLRCKVGVICPKAAIPTWERVLSDAGVEALFVLNIEKLKSKSPYLHKVGRNWAWALPPNTRLIFDEVHRFSAPNTQNAKILASAPRPCLMISATAVQDPTKMRAIGHQLGVTTWNEWFNWCGRMGCRRGVFGGIEFRGDKKVLDAIHRQIFNTGRGVRVRIADLGDAFPQNRLAVLDVPIENQKALDEAYERELKALELHAPNAAVEMLRARQLSEHCKLDSLIDRTQDYVEQGNSVAIFVNFRDSVARLKEAFPDAAVVHGDQTTSERDQEVQRFQSDKAHVIICMIQAGGICLSLHDLHGDRPRVSLVCLGWSAVEARQAIGRIFRANGKTPCIQFFVFAAGTIEQRVRRKVERKLDHIDTLNDGDLLPVDEPSPGIQAALSAYVQTDKEGKPGDVNSGEVGATRPDAPLEKALPNANGSNLPSVPALADAMFWPSGCCGEAQSGDNGTRGDESGTTAADGPHSMKNAKTKKSKSTAAKADNGSGTAQVPSLLPVVQKPASNGNGKVPGVHKDRVHAKISPSKLADKERCPRMEEDPNAETHPVTLSGTRCHEALDSGDWSKLQDDQERVMVEMCQDFTHGLAQEYPHSYNEIRLDITGGIFGYADRVFANEDHTKGRLVDYKFGFRKQEDVETNAAAGAYVLGMFKRWPQMEEVEVDYLYPRLELLSHGVFKRSQMTELELRVNTIVARVEEGAPAVYVPEVCTWCRFKATCPTLHEKVLPLATRYAKSHQMDLSKVNDFSVVGKPEHWSYLMSLAPVLEQMSESIKKHALEFRQNTGQDIPGFVLRSRAGKRKILNALMCWEVVSKKGIPQDRFLAAVEVSATKLDEVAAENAPHGQKGKFAAELSSELRDAGVLQVGEDYFYLQRSNK